MGKQFSRYVFLYTNQKLFFNHPSGLNLFIMKNFLSTFILCMIGSILFAQTDIVWGITTGNSKQLKKFTDIGANTGLTFSNPTG